jgi:hypothetical protein
MAPDIFHPQFSLYKWRSPKIECLHWFKNKVISDVGQIVTSTHTSKKAEIVLWSSLNHCLWITECRVWSLLTGCSNWVKVIAAKKTGKNPDDPDVFPPFQGWDVDFFFFFFTIPPNQQVITKFGPTCIFPKMTTGHSKRMASRLIQDYIPFYFPKKTTVTVIASWIVKIDLNFKAQCFWIFVDVLKLKCSQIGLG